MSVVPAQRLLWLVFAAAVLALVAGPLPDLIPLWLGVVVLVTIAALVDLAFSVSKMRPLAVSAPAISRFSKDREGTVEVLFANPERRAQRVRFALGLPAAFESPDEEISVEIPAEAAHASIRWRCTPRQRGRFSGTLACTEISSAFGL